LQPGIGLAPSVPREDSLVRITNDHPCTPTTATRTRTPAADANDTPFATTLASAVEASDGETNARPPELSAATYRLFAAIDLERGDTEHAALHLSRVPDAREAGVPLHPSGVLSEIGRWDYTRAAAALPETGRFLDTARSGQGEHNFIPYDATGGDDPASEDCGPAESAATDTATTATIRGRFAPRGAATDTELTERRIRAGIAGLFDV
jgi:hypothetical protein